jgi:serralysin
VTISGDSTIEADETFFMNLSNATGATISDNQGVGTITNDDSGPTFAISNATVTEGNSGATTATFTVTKTGATELTATVSVSTSSGTASSGSDYVDVAPTTLTFLSSETTKTVSVTINGDSTFEANETFFMNLSNASNATISDSQGLGTISNDDLAPTFAIDNATVTEGNSGATTATFTVTKTGATELTATVSAATSNGTASSSSDYLAVASTILTFAPSETTKTVSVTINGDSTFEADETFFVNLSTASSATISDSQGLGTITNDDADTTSPVRTNGQPDGSLQPGTTQVTISLQTDENAVCRYATTSGTEFSAMTNVFTTTGGLTHSSTITGITNGTTYDFYVRCQDSVGNANTNDYVIDFKVGGKKNR